MSEQNSQQATSPQPQGQGTSGLAIASLVLGVLAVLASFVPVINNGAFIIAIIGFVLALVGRSQIKKNGKDGSGIAIAGIVLNIIAIIVTLMVQAACSAALDSVTSNETGTVANGSAASAAASGSGASVQADTANMAVGQTVDMHNGLSITVNSVTPGLENFDGKKITGISVTIVNNSGSGADFNEYDWKAEDANGTQRSMAYYSEAVDKLSYGTLSAGGSVTGNIYFDEPIVKVYYYSNLLSSNSNIAWVVS